MVDMTPDLQFITQDVKEMNLDHAFPLRPGYEFLIIHGTLEEDWKKDKITKIRIPVFRSYLLKNARDGGNKHMTIPNLQWKKKKKKLCL